MRKTHPTGLSTRVNPTTGKRQYRARIQDPMAPRLPSGRTKQISSKWFDARSEALDWLEKQRHTKRTVGTVTFNRTVTVGNACDEWLETAKKVGIDGRRTIEETTSAQYAFLIRKYIKPSIGLLRIADLTKPMIMKWRDNQVSGIGKDATKRALGVVRQVLAYQAVLGNIPHNPASEVKLAAAAKKKRRSTVDIDDDPDDAPVTDYMSPEDVRAILHTVDTISAAGKLATDARLSKPLSPGNQAKRREAWIKYRALIYLLFGGGMRIGEACALQWKHILWGQSAINIRQAYKRTGRGKAKIGPPKNAASLRTITVGPEVMSLLRVLYVSKNARTETQFVFGTDEPPSPSNIRNRCWVPLMTEARLLAANGRVLWSPHDCRHYHASALINANKPLQQVSERLGHANTVVTQTVYAHLFKKLKGLGNTLGIEMEGALLGKG